MGLQRIAMIPARNPRRDPTRKPPPPNSPIAEKAIITVPQTVFASILEPNISAPIKIIMPETIPRIAEPGMRAGPRPIVLVGKARNIIDL